MSEFFAVLTNAGLARFANAQTSGQLVQITEVAVGDADRLPLQSHTALGNEVWRGPVRRLAPSAKDSKIIEVDGRIPPEDGGFTIREAGLFDANGDMIAIARTPEQYQPELTSGSVTDQIIRLVLAVTNSADVTLRLDPTIIMASLDDVQEALVPPRFQNATLAFIIARNALRAHPLFDELS